MFRRKIPPLPTTPVDYPSGVCVKTERGWFYIKNGKRYRIITQRILDSWRFPRVIDTTEAAVAKYRISGRIGFREGTLINNILDGKIYLVSENKRRQIESPDVLTRLGATGKDVICVSKEEISIQELGESIS